MTQTGVRGNKRGHFPGRDSNHWVIVVHYGNIGDYNYTNLMFINIENIENKSEVSFRKSPWI